MADNTILNPGVGGDTIATDDISGVKHELVKLEFGGNGSATMVDAANPLPVTDAVAEAALASIAAEDFATQVTLAAVLAKISSDPATQTTLAAILAKIIAAPSTEAKQDAANALLTTIAAITQPLTDAQLRAIPVPVSISGGGGGAVTIADGADITEGAIADAIVAAGATGSISAKLRRTTQGLEDLKTLITALPLPTGASTSALQTTGNTSLSTIAGKDFATQTTLAAILAKIIAAPSTEAKQDIIITALNSIDAGTAAALGQALMAASVPVVIASNQSAIPVSGTFFQATQPVSAASLPLPTGASTETTLASILAKIIASPATEATLALIKAKTDNIDVALSTRTKPSDQQHVIIDSGGGGATTIADGADVAEGAIADAIVAAGAAGTVSAKLRRVTQGLEDLKAGITALPLPTGAATGAKQDTGNTSLASIDAKLTNPLPVSISSDIEIGAVELKNGTDDTRATVTAANALKVDGSAVTQPVSAASLPLPSGAATAAKQDTGNTSVASIDTKTPALGQALAAASTPVVLTAAEEAILSAILTIADFDTKTGSLTETAPATDTASSGLNGRLQRIAQRLTSLITALGSPFQAGGSIGNTTFAATQAVAASLNMTEASAAAILAKLTAAAASMVKLEDAASASADGGVPSMAIRKATPANLSDTDGDYEMLQMSAGRLWVSAILEAGTALLGKVGIDQTTPGTTNGVQVNAALPAGNNNIGDVDIASIAAGANLIGKVGIDQTTPGTTNAVAATGNVAHDAVDSGNPVKVGQKAISFGTNPTAVASGDRTDWYANIAGIPFMIGGHPNIVCFRATYTAAQTDTAIITIAGGLKIVVTRLTVTASAANTVNVSVIVGFGTANTPTTTGVVLSHPGLAPGSGVVEGNGAGILGVGADGADLRITSAVPTSGAIDVVVNYFTIES